MEHIARVARMKAFCYSTLNIAKLFEGRMMGDLNSNHAFLVSQKKGHNATQHAWNIHLFKWIAASLHSLTTHDSLEGHCWPLPPLCCPLALFTVALPLANPTPRPLEVLDRNIGAFLSIPYVSFHLHYSSSWFRVVFTCVPLSLIGNGDELLALTYPAQ